LLLWNAGQPLTDTIEIRQAPLSAQAKPEKPCLVQLAGPSLGRKFLLEENETLIGRDEDCTIVLEMESVSRRHCRLLASEDGVAIADEGSTNGTFLNGTEVGGQTPLHTGDLIKIGVAIFKFLGAEGQGGIEAHYHDEMYRLTVLDSLTQLYNKRYATDFLEREASRSIRYERPLSLVLFDIDHFKLINDKRGHPAGDCVLRELSELMRKRIRREECLARWGGEEFALVLPDVREEQARFVADALRKLVAEHHFGGSGKPLRVTFSGGTAELRRDTGTVQTLIDAADGALYEAKRRGRNQVVAQSV
jgi:two-component system cell cycle response regulator